MHKLAIAAIGAGLVLMSRIGFAHPMGNLGISHYSALTVGARAVTIQYVLDMAEIPTFQEIQRHRITPESGHTTLIRYMDALGAQLARGLTLKVDEAKLTLVADRPCTPTFSEGAAGMVTMRVSCQFSVALGERVGAFRLHYQDDNYPRRSGWKEVIVNPAEDAHLISSSAPRTDRSAGLMRYPENGLNSPPQILSAQSVVKPKGTGAAKK